MDNLTTNDFDSRIGGCDMAIVVVKAPWCGDCKRIEPVLKAVESEHSDIRFFGVDFDSEEEIKEKLSISRIPTLIFYKNGKEVGQRIIEPKNRVEIENEITRSFR